MNKKERFKATLLGEKPDMPFLWESGFDDDAVLRWRSEGLPEGRDPFDFLGLDRVAQVGVGLHPIPALSERIIEEGDDFIVQENEVGGVLHILKRHFTRPSTRINNTSVVRWTLRDRASWEILRSRMDPYSPERLAGFDPFIKRERPADDGRWSVISGFWGSYAEEDGYPYVITVTGPTYWLVINAGFDNAAVMLYDDPELVSEIYDHYVWFITAQLKYLFARRVPDAIFIGEEICYKGGMFMSPEMYMRYACPGLDTVTQACRDAGIRFIFGGSGGYIEPVVPLWREIGINGLLPLDVSGGTDPIGIRKKYKDMYLIGGIDRIALENGRDAIAHELDTTARALYQTGRAIPSGDCHFAVSDKVSLDSMQYYTDGLRKLWHTV
jgi:hypothetical protein